MWFTSCISLEFEKFYIILIMIGYIYIHTSPSNKSYIGQTRQKDVNKRWQRGNGYLKNNQNNPISKAIKKYGWKNFKHDILEIVEEKDEEKLIYKLNQLEEDYILKLNTLHHLVII